MVEFFHFESNNYKELDGIPRPRQKSNVRYLTCGGILSALLQKRQQCRQNRVAFFGFQGLAPLAKVFSPLQGLKTILVVNFKG